MKDKNINLLPVLVSLGSFAFPGNKIELEIGRQKSKAAIIEAFLNHEQKIILVAQKEEKNMTPKAVPTANDIYHVGSLCHVDLNISISRKDFDTDADYKKALKETLKEVAEQPHFTVKLTGEKRVKLTDIKINAFYKANYELFPKEIISKIDEEELIQKIVNNLQAILDIHGSIPPNVISQISDGMRATEIIDKMAQFLTYLTVAKRQELLSETSVKGRLDLLIKDTGRQKNAASIEKEITNKIKDRIDEQQREYYLREKLRTIKEELGEIDGKSNEMKRYLERLDQEPFPENIKERVREEITRYDEMPQASTESNILRTYIDWIMSLPWHQKSDEGNYDLKYAQKVLDKHHYGLEKVKERIIEYLAVKKMSQSIFGQIICLVGPPGVGKTSLAKSVAEAMNRVFVKISLGGVKDESEIRGHRKTYVGAMPGRIIQGMKRAKVVNPVFLLDEIDKMASDYRGDPASALLEVLDPEQNSMFSDHYIEENYDLSHVMFITTANYIENIPEPLRDRMEIIELTSYTELEKLEIAKKYLVPKVNEISGLNNKLITYSNKAIEEMIKYYTRETGVRQLERLFYKVARKFIVEFLNKKLPKVAVTEENLQSYLGKHIFDFTRKGEKNQVGVVTGLAYTQFGGDILPIEVNYFRGKGHLFLTGKLGDVMKESATIALDYIKANSDDFEIDMKIFEENDIHIHVPEGAIPKDGPSAGITLTTAIISALTHRPVSNDIGMTGEITLRGHVLPIGGLKEKSISAHRSGLKTILIPNLNAKDLDQIPDEVKKKLTIYPVQNYREVYNFIFNKNNVQPISPIHYQAKDSKVTT